MQEMLYEDDLMVNGSNHSHDDDAPPARLTTPSRDADDITVEEYEQRYYGPRPVKDKPRSYSTMRVTDDERLWAAVAHASIWITMLGGIFTVGFVIPVSVFIPLVIYLMFRKRSDYVTFHALQAFVLQIIATLGVAVLAVVGGTAWLIGMVIAVLAIFVLAGIILVPLWGIIGIALALLVFLTPLAALLFGTMATVETWNRRDYRYPLVARWVDRQLAGGFLS